MYNYTRCYSDDDVSMTDNNRIFDLAPLRYMKRYMLPNIIAKTLHVSDLLVKHGI
jgi:hypothetical protein